MDGARPLALLPPRLVDGEMLRRSNVPSQLRTSAACKEGRLGCVYDTPNLCLTTTMGKNGKHLADGKKLSKIHGLAGRMSRARSFWEVASFLQSVLAPNNVLQKAVALQMERLPAPRLALHMRYGDSCGDDAQRTARR